MKKAIFFDIDGTLLNTADRITEISPKVKQALSDLKRKGHKVFIATGRPYAFISQAIKDIEFDGYVLANGAQVIIHNESISENTLNKESVLSITKQFDDNDIQYIIEGEKYSYVDRKFKRILELFQQVGISKDYIKHNYSIDKVNALKIEVVCIDKDKKEICKRIINEFSEFGHYSSIDESSFEIYSIENTKAAGILKALEYLNIAVEDSYAFGDGQNDKEMLSTVGCGIAMNNACDEVKKCAKYVTDSVKEDGVYFGVYKYILN